MLKMLNELTVMNDVAKILESLNGDERRRVIIWLTDFFGILDDDIDDYDIDFETGLPISFSANDDETVGETLEDAPSFEPEPDTFSTFFDKVAPKTAIQKIVTSAYWLETRDGKDFWKSFEINKLLKSIDIKVTSVSGTLGLEGKKDEPLVETLQKSGDSMQARKTFKLTEAGRDFVEGRLV